VLGLKLDPHAASLMAGELTSDHASYLRGRVGRSPTSGELYAAHFLGPSRLGQADRGGGRLARRQRRRHVPRRGGQANRSIFYKRRPRGHGRRGLRQPDQDRRRRRITEPTSGSPAETDQGFVQYATGRRWSASSSSRRWSA
jgi:hypothetical protein